MALLREGEGLGGRESPQPSHGPLTSQTAPAVALPPFPLPALSWVPGRQGRGWNGRARAIREQGPLPQTLREGSASGPHSSPD